MVALDLPIAFHTVDDVLLRGLQFGRTLELYRLDLGAI